MYDTIIIGLGCAGMSASVYAKRSGLNVLVIDEGMPGGLLNKVNIVENYLGYKSITGPELAKVMFDHVSSYDIPIKKETVLKIVDNTSSKTITTTKGVYETKSIILAIGRKPKRSGLANEEKFIGRGISYCAMCDAPLYKKKDIVVLGGGSSAFEEASYLKEFANSVTVLVRSEIRAEKHLVDEATSKGVKIITGVTVTSFLGEKYIEGVTLSNNDTIKCDGVFIYYGYEAETSFLKELNITNEKGYIEVDNFMRTKVPLIYACGDIIKKDLYQIITATSEGAIAATSAKKDLK